MGGLLGVDEVGDRGVDLLKRLKEPMLTLLSTSEYASKRDLQSRMDDAESAFKKFKSDTTELLTGVVSAPSEVAAPAIALAPAPMAAVPAPAPAVVPVPEPTPIPAPEAPVAGMPSVAVE